MLRELIRDAFTLLALRYRYIVNRLLDRTKTTFMVLRAIHNLMAIIVKMTSREDFKEAVLVVTIKLIIIIIIIEVLITASERKLKKKASACLYLLIFALRC